MCLYLNLLGVLIWLLVVFGVWVCVLFGECVDFLVFCFVFVVLWISFVLRWDCSLLLYYGFLE